LAAWPAGIGHPWSEDLESSAARQTIGRIKTKVGADSKGESRTSAAHLGADAGTPAAGSSGKRFSLLPAGPAGAGVLEDDAMPELGDPEENPA